MFLIFDTETTGLPRNYNAPISDSDNWPRMVQVAWQLHDAQGKLLEVQDFIIQPEGYTIPFNAAKIHGITTERAQNEGAPLAEVLNAFNAVLAKAKYTVGHNLGFDINIIGAEFYRAQVDTVLHQKIVLDTCTEQTAAMCMLPGGRGGKYKLPTLTELHGFIFKQKFSEAHNAAFDVEATARVALELLRKRHYTLHDLQAEPSFLEDFISANPNPFELIGLATKGAKEKREDALADLVANTEEREAQDVAHIPFAHLHNHTQFSVLQATSGVKELVNKAVADGMPGVAITDLANLMGAFKFNSAVLGIPANAEVHAHNKLVAKGQVEGEPKPYPFKGVIGCEFYVCRDHTDKTQKDNGFQLVALAKNKLGYHNLAKLSTIAYIDGMYYVPRIDKDLLLKYKEGLIILSGGLMGEVPNLILNVGEGEAEAAMQWYVDHFGEDFYIELNRHNLEEENHVNEVLLQYAEKFGVK